MQEQKDTRDSNYSKCDATSSAVNSEIGASTKNSTIINDINGAVNNATAPLTAEDKISKVRRRYRIICVEVTYHRGPKFFSRFSHNS